MGARRDALYASVGRAPPPRAMPSIPTPSQTGGDPWMGGQSAQAGSAPAGSGWQGQSAQADPSGYGPQPPGQVYKSPIGAVSTPGFGAPMWAQPGQSGAPWQPPAGPAPAPFNPAGQQQVPAMQGQAQGLGSGAAGLRDQQQQANLASTPITNPGATANALRSPQGSGGLGAPQTYAQ